LNFTGFPSGAKRRDSNRYSFKIWRGAMTAPAPFGPKATSFYGEVVQAAYSMYSADPSNLQADG